jgi:hypothetical protein
MAAITQVFTIRRAAQILGRDEQLLWDLSDQLEPEDGVRWIYDLDAVETLAFTDFGIENLRRSSEIKSTVQMIRDRANRGTRRMVTKLLGIEGEDRRQQPSIVQ